MAPRLREADQSEQPVCDGGEPQASPPPTPSPPASPPLPQQQQPPPQPPAATPDLLPLDHTLPDLLREVSGSGSLPSVKQLKLRVIARETSLQRLGLYVPALRELNLDGSCLGSLRDLGCGLNSLQVLRVVGCGLESLDGTLGLTGLRELYAAHNRIADASPVSFLARIRVLDLSRNAVRDMAGVSFLSVCRHLQRLSLAGCPVSSTNDYRAAVRRVLPALSQLDGSPLVTEQSDTGVSTSVEDDVDGDEQGGVDDSGGPEDAINHKVEASSGDDSVVDGCSRVRPHSASPGSQPLHSSTPKRPHTAAPGGRVSAVTSGTDLSSEDSPSVLTSGEVLCGNLAAALRGRRHKRRDAWKDADHKDGANASSVDSPAPTSSSSAERDAGRTRLLEASRRWRQLYTAFRAQHKDEWEQEAAAAAPAQPRPGPSGGVLGCPAQLPVGPCCAAMAAATAKWRRRTDDDGYDADASSDLAG